MFFYFKNETFFSIYVKTMLVWVTILSIYNFEFILFLLSSMMIIIIKKINHNHNFECWVKKVNFGG